MPIVFLILPTRSTVSSEGLLHHFIITPVNSSPSSGSFSAAASPFSMQGRYFLYMPSTTPATSSVTPAATHTRRPQARRRGFIKRKETLLRTELDWDPNT
eukprot:scaffold320_cov367-Pinguiococcus_pyrenoidosus.AAC.16